MSQSGLIPSDDKIMNLATFYIGDALCGMDILGIQEINKHMEMTVVPQSPEYVMGILNLRGHIVTVIDLGKKLGLVPTRITDKTRNIIVNSKDEHIGLVVDRICDVVEVTKDMVEMSPANIGTIQGSFFEGVFKTADSLIGILDLEAILREE